jgi:hypothetical protein
MLIARKTGTIALAAALSLGALATLAPTEASAQYRRYGGGYGHYRGGGGWGRGGAAAAGVIGGLALGALAAGAMSGPPAYPAYGPGYYPAYGGYCTIQRERYWDGWRWRVHRVRVCD